MHGRENPACDLNIAGTSGSDESTYVELELHPSDLNEIDDACPVGLLTGADVPLPFSRADLFNGKKKRLSDTDRVEAAFDNSTDRESNTGTSVQELTAELKRKKQRP